MISISRLFLFTAIALLPFSHFKLISNFSVSDFFFLVSFIFIFSHQINNSNSLKKLLLDNDFLIPILFYSIGFFISIDTSFNPVDSIFGYFQILFIFIIIYYSFSFHIISEIFLIRLLYILAFISSMITLFILLYFLTNIDYSLNILLVQKGWGASRFSYGLMEPNIAARIAAQSLPILILFSMKGKNIGIKISNSFLDNFYLKLLKNKDFIGGKIIGAGGGGFFLMVTKNRLKSEKFLKKNNFKFMRVNFDFNGSSIIKDNYL